MDLRRLQSSGQAALEYMLILTVVAVVIFLAMKPSSTTPSVLNKAQSASEGYFNTVSEVIMGKNPKPIDGGWCPPKPNGERECACPQPQFGGASCSGQGSNIEYCGDNICQAGETGEPGHPFNISDPLTTCFEDCDYLPDCDQCATLVPAAACGEACGSTTCSGVQVCMRSDCPSGCPGFISRCEDNPQLCSGACRCDPNNRTEVSGCGVPSGACLPTWLEKCFQFNNCNSSCTPAQTVQAIKDPQCGICPEQEYPIPCGPTGTVTMPETLNGSTGSVACPAGCTQTQGPMSALCTDGVFGVLQNQCQPAVCLPMTYDTGICGTVSLPITSPGLSTPQVPCPDGCSGFVVGVCPAGSATFSVSHTCVPNNCAPLSYPTGNCGLVDLPQTNHGESNTVPCPSGCSGAGVSYTCDRGTFGPINVSCVADCPATPVNTGTCGTVTLPAIASGATSSENCPGGCSGTVSAVCTDGIYGIPTINCVPGCADLPVSAGACGSTTLTGTTSGSTSVVACPGGCSGTLSATCTNGAFEPVINDCGCPATTVTSICGPVDLSPVPNNSESLMACPGSCTGTVSATCVSGSFGSVSDLCNSSCPMTQVATPCGPVDLPAGANGNTPTVACPVGCSGTGVSATCSNGAYGTPTISCTANPCVGQSIPTPCGDADMPGVSSGAIGIAPCPSGCSGGFSALCTNGVWDSPPSGSCAPSPCPPTPVTTSCGTFSLPAANHGVLEDEPCTGLCSGLIHGTCSFGNYIGITNNCIAITCIADGQVNDSDTIQCPGPVFGSNVRIPAPQCCSGFARYTCLASPPSEINDITGLCSP